MLGYYMVENIYKNNGKTEIKKPEFVASKYYDNTSDDYADYYYDYFEDEKSAYDFYKECLGA